MRRFLARGGMGEVYEVEDLELHGRLALKTILPRKGTSGDVDRFKREIQLARMVTHPNVCRIYDFGQHRLTDAEPVVFLTMELLRGETMAQQLRRRGPMRPSECGPLVRQMASALEAAHRAGVVHRDLKSENIFLVPDGAGTRLVVTDFGIARGGGGHDHFGAMVTGGGSIGTPAYMAPEQVEGKVVTHTADLYALGVVMYEMVTGCLPFEAPDPITAAVKRLSEAPTPPRNHAPDLDPTWEAVILRCLARQPEDRFASAEAVAAALPTGSASSSQRFAPPGTSGTVPQVPSPLGTTPHPIQAPGAEAPTAVPHSSHGTPAGWPAPTGTPAPLVGAQPTATQNSATATPGSSVATPHPHEHHPTGQPPTAPPSVAPPLAAQGATTPAASARPQDPAARTRTRRLLGMLVAVLLVSAALWTWNLLRDAEDGDRRLVAPRRAVAVLGFRNLSNNTDDAWLDTALTEMLSTELDQGESIRVVPGATVARMREELGIELGAPLPGELLETVRTLLSCDFLSTGSYLAVEGPQGGSLRLDLKLQDAATGTVLETQAFDGPRAELFDLVGRAGSAIRQQLGADEPTGERPVALPSEPRAARLYAEALDLLRRGDPQHARDLLVEAGRLEPDNAMIQIALSTAWQGLGYQQQAGEAAERAFQLSRELEREDRLDIEGRYRETLRDWTAAAEAYGALWDYRPDNLEYGLRLAAAETADFRPADALDTVGEIRDLPPPLGDDLRIDMAESRAHGVSSDFEGQLTAATTAASKAETLGASLLLARAEILRSSALRNLGRQDEAVQAAHRALTVYSTLDHEAGQAHALVSLANAEYERGAFEMAQEHWSAARDRYREIGDRGGDAAVIGSLAMVLRKQGAFARAEALYEEAAETFREIGNRAAIANNLNNLATLFAAQEKLTRARELFEESRAMWLAIGNKSGEGYALANISGVLRRAGALDESLALGQRGLELRREIGHPVGEMSSLAGLAAIHLDRGDLAQARRDLNEAEKLAEELEARNAQAQIDYLFGELARAEGNFEDARERHERALAIRQEMDEPMLATESRLALARLALEEGQAAAAAVEAQLVLDVFRRQSRMGEAARAGAVLVTAHLAGGQRQEATRMVEEIVVLAEANELATARYEVAIARARAQQANLDQTIRELGTTANEIDAAAYRCLALDARLAVAELHLRRGNTDEGRDLATQIAAVASAGGFEATRRRAEALLTR